jgi:hypothetical protein
MGFPPTKRTLSSRLAEPFDAALDVVSIESLEELFHRHALLAGPLKSSGAGTVVLDPVETLLQEL